MLYLLIMVQQILRRSLNIPRTSPYLLEQMQPSELKPQEMTFSSSGRMMRETLLPMSLGSKSARLKTLARFVFTMCRKVTKVTTDA